MGRGAGQAMSDEILVNVTPQETRVALIESGVLQEIFVERASRFGLVGNVYKGRVQRVLPGMQAAFVEMGLERTGFLHASDIRVPDAGADTAEPDIRTLLREGDEVLVQVIKEPLGTKGARLTTQLSIPSRYLVLLPFADRVGVSTRIEDEAERERLKSMVSDMVVAEGAAGGYIVRTAGEGMPEQAARSDLRFLLRLWTSIRAHADALPAGSLVHGDLPLVMRILRDLLGTQVERVRIDSRAAWRRVRAFAERFIPEVAQQVEFYDGERPIFDLYGVEDELQRALERKVTLKSGGYLIIDQTEAMTTVDVNTGGYVGHRNLEETIFKTNLEAAQALARQLRLRNLGGIIIVDFIDMIEGEHKRQVLKALEKALARDHAKSVICDVSPLGLVEMTRKRTRESLEHVLCEGCPTCRGRGSVKTVETVSHEIAREVMRSGRQFDPKEFLVVACPDVISTLLDEQSTMLAELEEIVSRPIRLQAETLYQREQFDVVLM